MQNADLKSPDLKRISHMGLICMLRVYKLISTSDVICNVYGLFGQDKRYRLGGCVYCALPTRVTDPTQNIAHFFMYVIIQELLNMNVLVVSEINLKIQWILQ